MYSTESVWGAGAKDISGLFLYTVLYGTYKKGQFMLWLHFCVFGNYLFIY